MNKEENKTLYGYKNLLEHISKSKCNDHTEIMNIFWNNDWDFTNGRQKTCGVFHKTKPHILMELPGYGIMHTNIGVTNSACYHILTKGTATEDCEFQPRSLACGWCWCVH